MHHSPLIVLGILSEIAYPGIHNGAFPENRSYLTSTLSLITHLSKSVNPLCALGTIPFLPVRPFDRFLTDHSITSILLRSQDHKSKNASPPHSDIERRDAR